MDVEVRVPNLGESIVNVRVAVWLAADGAMVEAETPLAELETDKAAMTVAAPNSGRLKIAAPAGQEVREGSLLATIESVSADERISPAPQKTAAPEISAAAKPAAVTADAEIQTAAAVSVPQVAAREAPLRPGERRVPMSTLRQSLARRLVAVKNETAMLTTFNEVDLSAVQELRRARGEEFKQKHGVKLGLMSFFVKAAALGLREFPDANACIDQNDLIYHDFVHMGIAVAAPRGLMVPVIRDADQLSLAAIEQAIAALAEKARSSKLTLDEMAGGTFTITNGGVFGSLLSTPILNPPQAAILGMHTIQDRPIAWQGQVVIRPMMYLALSYDHRLLDGGQAVGFLKRVKELIEGPGGLFAEG